MAKDCRSGDNNPGEPLGDNNLWESVTSTAWKP
jgi:hypothetical protein